MQKRKVLCPGEKPSFISSKKPITKREWYSSLSKAIKKDAIMEGFKLYTPRQQNYKNSGI